MYQFIPIKSLEKLQGSSKINDLCLFPENNDILLYGVLQNLFGKPVYESDDYENAYCYAIKAFEESIGKELYFTVYQGPTGCAIGASERTSEMTQAIKEFQELIKDIEPVDYIYEGNYEDAFVKIKFGIQNGQVIYEESDLEEEE